MEIPKHYSLHSEDDSHFMVHDKRDGKTFKIAKKELHPAHQVKILRMQKLADGGDVGDTGEDGAEEGVATITPPQGISSDNEEDITPPQGLDTQVAASDLPPTVGPEQPTTAGPQAAPAAPQVPGNMPGNFSGNFPTSKEAMNYANQQVSAVQKEASAQEKQQQAMAEQYQKNIDEEQKLMQAHQEKMVQYQNQYDQISSDVASAKIDPNKYWNDKTTGGKISSAIGILLGGLGAGLTKGPNMALDLLNKHIEQDIQSQRDNLGNKRSLLGDNLRAQGTMMAAMNATRLQMIAIAQGKLQKVAAETGNPIIAARAQQSAAQIMQGTIPLRSQLANNELQMGIRGDVLRRLQGQGQQGVPNVDMNDLARAGLVDKATAEKEGAAISKRQQSEAFAIDEIKKLNEEQSVFSKNFPYVNPVNPESYKRRDMARANISQAIQDASPSKRLNPDTLALEIEPFLTKTLDSDATREDGMNSILNLIRKHADPTPAATHYGIPGAIGGKNTIRKSFQLGPVK